MMDGTQPGFTELFAQLGLECDEASIQRFLRTHAPLADDVEIQDAAFWSEQQAMFLKEKIASDGSWAIAIDQLSTALRTHPKVGDLPQIDD